MLLIGTNSDKFCKRCPVSRLFGKVQNIDFMLEARRVLRIFVYGGVRMEGKIQTQKHGFPENFARKNIGILHISYPKIWVKIVF